MGTTWAREQTAERLRRVGVVVVPRHEVASTPVDIVVVHCDGSTSAAAAVAASWARARVPHLVLGTPVPHPTELVGAILAGAHGWLSEDISDGAFSAAVTDVLGGTLSLGRRQVGPVVAELRRRSERTVRRADGRPVQLSTREWDVLSALASGAAGVQVAAMLSLDQATVRGYVASAVRRLQAGDRAEAVRLFLEAGDQDDDDGTDEDLTG